MTKAFTDEPPFRVRPVGNGASWAVELEGAGSIGTITTRKGRYYAHVDGRRAGTFPSKGDAALAIWVEHELEAA